MKKKIRYIIKYLTRTLNLIQYYLIILPYTKWLHSQVDVKKIIFISMKGANYGCNPKAISDYIIKNHTDKFNIFWAFDSTFNIDSVHDEKIQPVKLGTLAYYRHLATSNIIVSNQRLDKTLKPPKKPEQIYIQTWHGTIFKKIEKDALDSLSKQWIKIAQYDSYEINYILAGSSFMSNWFKKSFWYNGRILDIGTPRNDIFFNPDLIENAKQKFKRHYDIANNANIVLYAPTFRNHSDFDVYKFDPARLIKELTRTLGGQWILIFRFHPNLLSNQNYKSIYDSEQNNLIDATTYVDMQEILCATDLLITDYSSSMFDYMLLKRPCLLFAKDLETYDRGFVFDVTTLPFTLAQNETELYNNIQTISQSNYRENIDIFTHKMGYIEKGTASQSLVELLLSEINNSNMNDQEHV